MEEIVERICRIPIDFYDRDVSAMDLVRASGLVGSDRILTRQAIAAYLHRHPFLIEHWLRWSEDQRCSPAWTFEKDKERYSVQFHLGGERYDFDDGADACVEFIRRWVESVRL